MKNKVKELDANYKFLDGDPQKPMLILGKSLSTSRLVSIIFRPGPGMLCTKQPLKVKKECSFLVDLRRISLEDLRADGNTPYDKYDFFHTSFMFCQSVIYIYSFTVVYRNTEPRN